MSAKMTAKRMALVVVAFAVASLVGSVAGASGVAQVGGNASGLASLFDNGTYRLELGAITGSGSTPEVCVKVTSKASNRRAQGCGEVNMFVHPTLDMAVVNGTVQGDVVDAKTGRTLRRGVPIKVDVTYEGIGMYTAIVASPHSELFLYPMDVAASQTAGLARAAWGWGSVTAPVCQSQKATSSGRFRQQRTRAAADVTCGPVADAPAFAGTIAQMLTVGAGTAGN